MSYYTPVTDTRVDWYFSGCKSLNWVGKPIGSGDESASKF